VTDQRDASAAQIKQTGVSSTNSPLWIVYLGLVLVLTVLVVGIIDDPQKVGLGAWKGYLFYWLFSLLSYLVPFGFFVARDLAVRSAAGWGYSTSKRLVSFLRIALLVFGMSVSTFFMFGLATDLATLSGEG